MSGFYPYNPTLGQKFQTNVEGITVDASFLAHIQIDATDAIAADDDGVHAAIALAAITQEIKTNITSPKIPRNITITGNAAGVAGDVVIHGTNYADVAIEETIALNGNTAVEGAKAFKTVTQIDLPVETHVGTDTVKVGFGDKLGIPYLLSHNTLQEAVYNNVKEAVAATVTVSATDLESNTVDLNTALAGKVVDLYLIV
jgi:hypothetical protein